MNSKKEKENFSGAVVPSIHTDICAATVYDMKHYKRTRTFQKERQRCHLLPYKYAPRV